MPPVSPSDLPPAYEKAVSLADSAVAAFEQHDLDEALALTGQAIATDALSPRDATRLVELLRALGETDMSAKLAADTLSEIEALAALAQEDPEALTELGHLSLELERHDLAEAMLMRAHELGDTSGKPEILLLHILLERGEPQLLLQVWETFLNKTPEQAKYGLFLARGLAHFGYRKHAEHVLIAAEPLYRDNRQAYEETLANVRGEPGKMPQQEMAAMLFDMGADSYDENLQAIGNAGPMMIARMLRHLELSPDASLQVLDAGCGTGLCAPFLRPFAAHLLGCDVSVKMLELCREKQLYDALARTDLALPETYAPGPYDLVVSGDVFVYFQDLEPVLSSIASVLKPGGWVIFTVEDCTDEAPELGYAIRSSGRTAHASGHLAKTLAKAGFAAPEAEFTDVLRREFRSPITGRAIAARKLAPTGETS